jgi:nitroreductase
VDAYLAVVSKREVRDYEARPVPEDVLVKILQAGRASGSSKNRQPWRFIVLRDRERHRTLAGHMTGRGNLERCAVAIAIVLLNDSFRFDAGRCAQNMMIAAWTLGVGSCPNSVHPDHVADARTLLGLPADASVATVITLGYPAPGQPRPRANADPERVLRRIKRLPLEELVFQERFNG